MQFLNAYDVHMRKVYKEMDYLTKKADMNKSSHMEHQIITKLLHRSEWFQDEALQLSKQVKLKKATINDLVAKLKESEQTNIIL